MHPIASCAERTLREHVHPALRFSELIELVAELMDRTLDVPRLRAILQGHPDRFRILDPWQGPWRSVVGDHVAEARGHGAWVVLVTDPGDPPAEPRAAAVKLRESVRWLARGIDPRSATEVSRWYAIALAERAAREAVVRRAA